MDEKQAAEVARAWLLTNGYTQWPDGCWQHEGYEAEADSVLTEYIMSKDKE